MSAEKEKKPKTNMIGSRTSSGPGILMIQQGGGDVPLPESTPPPPPPETPTAVGAPNGYEYVNIRGQLFAIQTQPGLYPQLQAVMPQTAPPQIRVQQQAPPPPAVVAQPPPQPPQQMPLVAPIPPPKPEMLQQAPVMPQVIPQAVTQVATIPEPSSFSLRLQTRNVEFQCSFSLNTILSREKPTTNYWDLLVATLKPKAIELLGLQENKPQFIFPKKVCLQYTISDSKIPLIGKLPWIDATKFITNQGQEGNFPVHDVAFKYDNFVLYEMTKEEFELLTKMKQMVGITKEQLLYGLTTEDIYTRVPAGTHLYHICSLTYASELGRMQQPSGCLLIETVRLRDSLRLIEGDLNALRKMMIAPQDMNVKFDILRPQKWGIDTPVDPKVLMEQIVSTMPQDEAARDYFLKKTNTVSVGLSVKYFTLC